MNCCSLRSRTRAFLSDRGRGGEGQAMAEFAIAFPLQLFITFGIMQLILLYISTLLVNYASFRACRAALVGEDPRLAAAMVLAPVAGSHLNPADKSASPVQTIPGWGDLYNSDTAYAKTLAYPVEYEDPDEDKNLTVVVEFDQELVFPVVDALFATFYKSDEADKKQMVFGDLDEGFSDADYMLRTPAYDTGTKKLKDDRGRIRKIGGVYHFLIVRECTMYQQYAANYSKGGEIDTGKKK